LVICVPLAFFFGSGTYTLCETQMIEDLARQRRGHEFGRARKWGSGGFLVAAMAGGALFSSGGVARNFSLALAACAALFALCCVALQRASHVPLPDAANPAAEAPPVHDTTAAADSPISAWRRLGQRGVIGCAAVAAMRLAEAVATTWFGAYWLHTGHGTLETGILCALPVAMEFLAMWKGGPLMARFSAPVVMLICCLLSALRWVATPYCSALWCAIPLQSVHAFTFGFFYPASLLWLKQQAGPHFFHVRYLTEAGARALTAVVTFAAAGWVIARWGYAAIFGVAWILALASAVWWWRSAFANVVQSRH
jgi:PPP family 3-phenylpropionic acid transporter